MPKDSLLEYVSRPPPPSHRVYCTLIPSSISSTNSLPSSSANSAIRQRHPLKYTLYVEHMGNLIPVLEATRRSSKLRPSFTISLPSDDTSSDNVTHTPRLHPETTSEDSPLDQSDNPQNDTTVRCSDEDNTEAHNSLNTESGIQLAYKEDDNDVARSPAPNAPPTEGPHSTAPVVSSSRHVAEVSSHIINSKFRIQSVSHKLPCDMGTITIKTSFLHIQPRKVVVHLPPQESDSGVESDLSCDDASSDESDVFPDSAQLSLDSLSSMEELTDSKHTVAAAAATSESSVAKTPSTYHKPPYSLRPLQSTHSLQQQQQQSLSSGESNLIIHSKTPTWNEQHMIYQLDFGGRVTTKSAKNFQLEMGTDQVSKS